LPQVENSVVGNRPWRHKQMFYRLLAAQTDEEQEKIKKDAQAIGLVLSAKADKAMASAKYLYMCASLTSIEDDWSVELIASRSLRIAELAWEQLAPWLDLPPT
jgi:hypothetical protein